jgi:hypothetical protein
MPPSNAFRKPNSQHVFVKLTWSGPEGVIEDEKEFIVDTGAESSTVTPSNARRQGLQFAGYKGSRGVGGTTNTPAWEGGTMRFKTLRPDGTPSFINCNTVVTEADFNLLGQDQLRPNGVTIFNGDPPAMISGFTPPPEKP